MWGSLNLLVSPRNCSYGLKTWLGGLDSNQDNQDQNLVSYQLNDLPVHTNHRRVSTLLAQSGFPSLPTRELVARFHECCIP